MRLLLALLLAGCTASFDYARDVDARPMVSRGATQGEVTIIWRMGDAEYVNRMCNWRPHLGGMTHGCAILDEKAGRCAMFVQQPRDFQDMERLALLAHEVWHCMGAKHT